MSVHYKKWLRNFSNNFKYFGQLRQFNPSKNQKPLRNLRPHPRSNFTFQPRVRKFWGTVADVWAGSRKWLVSEGETQGGLLLFGWQHCRKARLAGIMNKQLQMGWFGKTGSSAKFPTGVVCWSTWFWDGSTVFFRGGNEVDDEWIDDLSLRFFWWDRISKRNFIF